MYLSRIFLKRSRNVSHIRTYSNNKNPFTRTLDTISMEVPKLLSGKQKSVLNPEHVDIVVIGGGFIGSSVAYWLKTRTGEGLSIMVIDKDLKFEEAQQNHSLGLLTQHFSLPENITLSQYGADFLRNVKENLGLDVDIQYQPRNSLVLASEKYAEKLEQNVAMQREFGIKNEILSGDEIKQRFPWLNMHDIKLGCLGNECEGVFNSSHFLRGLIQKSKDLGAIYVNGEVIGFELEKQKDVLMEGVEPGSFERITRVIYKTVDNEEHKVKFACCILAAGDRSGQIAKLAKIGTGEGLLTIPLPIEKREFDIYSIDDETKRIGLNAPLILDTSGLWLQKNGLDNQLLCGHVPLVTKETKKMSTEEYYMHVVKPSIFNRLSQLEGKEVIKVSTGIQDCNTYDDTAILGPHPYHNNLYMAAGFGRQGCIHAPGVGRAIAELIIDSHYATIDLTRFGFDRILVDQPMMEFNIY